MILKSKPDPARRLVRTLLLSCLALVLVACGEQLDPPATPATTAASPPPDPHSFARFDRVRSTHLDLAVTVDFENRVLSGTITHELERLVPEADRVLLDSRALTIRAVSDPDTGAALTWSLGAAVPPLGAPLEIELAPATERVTIAFESSPDASGLQWLTPEQTAGGEHPFLFSQAQAIHARSFLPVQDSPAVRTTFDAVVRVPDGLRAVMAAEFDPAPSPDGSYRFRMPQPIPAYLIAIAAGDLAFQPMSERTGIWSEPAMLASAVHEFADTERMMQVSETLFGPYRWGRYDLLILPPSFPFGGMENPRLSFITPTVIAGDRSLVALIAHELAHSWSGNLVTNGRWDDLWLNEGFTVYLEARIMEAVFGAERRRMEDVLGYQALINELETLPTGDQRLVPQLGSRDPDDAFSNVPYEKGRLLLVWLEQQLGREAFDALLRSYFDEHAFQSMTTERFEAWLLPRLSDHGVDGQDLRQWIHEPGLPENAVVPSSDAFERVDAARSAWLAGELPAAELPVSAWTVHEWLHFVTGLPEDSGTQRLADLDAAHALTDSSNAEIAHAWLLQAIRHRYEPAMPRLHDYLVGIGRNKLIVPLYRALHEQDWGRPLAAKAYATARPGYHPLTRTTLDALLR